MNLFRIMNIKGINRCLVTSASKGDNWKWPSYQFLSSTRLTPLSIYPYDIPRFEHNEDNYQTL
jgi:hypothetical protein